MRSGFQYSGVPAFRHSGVPYFSTSLKYVCLQLTFSVSLAAPNFDSFKVLQTRSMVNELKRNCGSALIKGNEKSCIFSFERSVPECEFVRLPQKYFWNTSKSLVTIKVFTSGTWAPIRLCHVISLYLMGDHGVSCLGEKFYDRDQKVGKAETYQFFLIRSQFLLAC